MSAAMVRVSPSNDPSGRDPAERSGDARVPSRDEDLPYKVEIWDDASQAVEQVLAITANSSIGYAAYYAATREFPTRRLTLRCNDRVISRWNGPPN